MFKKTKADDIKSYMASLPEDRKAAIKSLDVFIKKTVPKLKPHFAYNMLGYGTFPYKNYKGEDITWPVISLASQKNYMSLYICAVHDGKYIAEQNQRLLGKVSVGKSCIRFKKLEDIDLKGLTKILKLAAKSPGLVGVGASAKKEKKK